MASIRALQLVTMITHLRLIINRLYKIASFHHILIACGSSPGRISASSCLTYHHLTTLQGRHPRPHFSRGPAGISIIPHVDLCDI
eukprot:c43536_g1_i1 orf=129-383(-)